MKIPTAVEDSDYHFGRTVSIDKQSMDTAAISCTGCDPGLYKTGTIDASEAGSQGRGAVYIYKGNEATNYRHWTATQILWPRHNRWYYFGGGFTQMDGNTLVADACRGTHCTDDTFVRREYNAPSTDLFIYVKQEKTGLWSEQQVLTDPVMEAEAFSKIFNAVSLHDDTIAMGYTLQVSSYGSTATQGTDQQAGLVLVWYPNKPNYELKETFRHKAGVKLRGKSNNSPALNQHQWSLQQFLRNEVASTSFKTYFGMYLSISGDRMAVAARGITSGSPATQPVVTLFTRPRQGGLWSQQQILIHPDEAKEDVTSALIYNNIFATHGLQGPMVQYQSEMAHGKWKCLLVSMFDEFGDGWDTAKLRVSYSDGTYDYYYPDCNSPNPLEFEYCPSMSYQGGTYTFEIVDHVEAKFNWEIEWKVQMNLVEFQGMYGNSSDVFLADRHSRMSFYWNPITLSFEKLETQHLIKSTISCSDCPERGSSHRIRRGLSSAGMERVSSKYGEDVKRALSHSAKTAAPTVSPAPTMAQSEEYIAEWEKLVMTTSNPLQPWFKDDRSGTYFILTDLEGKRIIRRESQCGGGLTPLTHSCWMNYPEPIPDGEYIARIGGARAGLATGLHTWSFCGVDGGQLEHFQFKVQNGQCYPVQRFTKSRFCSFKEGSGVLAEMIIDLGAFEGSELMKKQRQSIFQSLSNLIPDTRARDYSISSEKRGSDGHMHITVKLHLNLLEHGFDPSDFTAISELEEKYNKYMYEAATSGALATAFSESFQGTGSSIDKDKVQVQLMKFDSATIPRGEIIVDDDSPKDFSESIDKDWLLDYKPASSSEVKVYSVVSYLSDAIAVCGYFGLLVCAVYGAKAVQRKYRENRRNIQHDLESASTVIQSRTTAITESSRSGISSVKDKMLNALDDFSDYVFSEDVTRDSSTGAPLIGQVAIPSVGDLIREETSSARRKRKENRRNVKRSSQSKNEACADMSSLRSSDSSSEDEVESASLYSSGSDFESSSGSDSSSGSYMSGSSSNSD